MCGVIGYVGDGANPEFFYTGLKRLEYRGYDSAGIAMGIRDGIQVVRASGKLLELQKKLVQLPRVATVGIGHTRWATHGEPTERNAHPHVSGPFVLLHNGIIENYQELRSELQREGYEFKSETDTEAVVHLLCSEYAKLANVDDDVVRVQVALRATLRQLRGAYAFAILCSDTPGYLFAAKQGSPLVLGRGRNENYLASGIPALIEHTSQITRLEDGDIAVMTRDDISVIDRGGQLVQRDFLEVNMTPEMLEKEGFEHFMLKEIFQHPLAIRSAIENRLLSDSVVLSNTGLGSVNLGKVARVQALACGTSYYACMVGKYFIEEHCGIPVDVDLASEFRYRPPTLTAETLAVAVSQSGETIDTLFALKHAGQQGAQTLAMVNSEGSSIEHEADATMALRAGVEIGVASTKAFSAQVTSMVLLGLALGEHSGRTTPEARSKVIAWLQQVPQVMEGMLERIHSEAAGIGEELVNVPGFLFMGRGRQWPVAQEGALKLKELAYVFAEAHAGGELKHGSIALIDKTSWVIAVAPRDGQFEKIVSNIAEIKARGGNILAVGTEGDSELESLSDIFIGVPGTLSELSPLLTAIPLHFLAYWVARHKGYDIDQPRNLAKSVTVE